MHLLHNVQGRQTDTYSHTDSTYRVFAAEATSYQGSWSSIYVAILLSIYMLTVATESSEKLKKSKQTCKFDLRKKMPYKGGRRSLVQKVTGPKRLRKDFCCGCLLIHRSKILV